MTEQQVQQYIKRAKRVIPDIRDCWYQDYVKGKSVTIYFAFKSIAGASAFSQTKQMKNEV